MINARTENQNEWAQDQKAIVVKSAFLFPPPFIILPHYPALPHDFSSTINRQLSTFLVLLWCLVIGFWDFLRAFAFDISPGFILNLEDDFSSHAFAGLVSRNEIPCRFRSPGGRRGGGRG